MQKRAARLTLAALLMAAPAAFAQQQSLTNLGTLTCTTGDAPPQSAGDATLSCSFKGQSGLDGDFTGRIARRGAAGLPGGKRVLVWSVLSAKAKVELSAIEGEYTGVTGGDQPHALVGGANRSILLQPMTATSQIGDAPVPSVLELRLKPTKA